MSEESAEGLDASQVNAVQDRIIGLDVQHLIQISKRLQEVIDEFQEQTDWKIMVTITGAEYDPDLSTGGDSN